MQKYLDQRTKVWPAQKVPTTGGCGKGWGGKMYTAISPYGEKLLLCWTRENQVALEQLYCSTKANYHIQMEKAYFSLFTNNQAWLRQQTDFT